MTTSSKTAVGQLRDQWITECGATAEEFAAFIRCLRLRLGSTNATADVSDHVAERMINIGLRHDEAALLLACGIVRNWIKRGVQKLTRATLDAVIAEHDSARNSLKSRR